MCIKKNWKHVNPKKVATRDGKAFSTNKIEIKETRYLNPKYEIAVCSTNPITPTGLLIVGKLNPKETGLPDFCFRWDEKAEALDVDIDGVSEAEKEDFKNGRNGYQGHHTIRIASSNDRIFELDIGTPQIKVFTGCLSVCLNRELELNEKTSLTDSIKI